VEAAVEVPWRGHADSSEAPAELRLHRGRKAQRDDDTRDPGGSRHAEYCDRVRQRPAIGRAALVHGGQPQSQRLAPVIVERQRALRSREPFLGGPDALVPG
jgi:hypothetical protein